ncbi:MAG: hypothetical protein JRG86_06560 [Deltaproteobacteria bacterium]|jgi:hypothetical protein|nr:hypothetical protein [Deltaproteobacteria bacterium]MBW2499637.1 hypothetical protein [Deltaproteobacteria bacterium]
MADRTARFSSWFQIISNIALIVGLALVVYELNQSKLVANGQMIDAHASRMNDQYLAMMGEDPREALAKAALHPADLDEKDAVTLDAFYTSIISGWANLYFTSGLLDVERRWRAGVSTQARMYFSSEPGRRWLQATAADPPMGLTEIFDLALASVGEKSDDPMRATYELLLAKD